jgi:hypothetical protein
MVRPDRQRIAADIAVFADNFSIRWDLEKRARMARSDEAGAIWEIGRNLRLWTIMLMPHSGIVSSNAAVPPTLF